MSAEKDKEIKRMKKKKVLKESFARTKKFFWVYLAAVFVVFVVTGIGNGITESFSSLSRFVLSMRNGLVTYGNIIDINSEFWNVMTDGRIQGIGTAGFLVTLFAANPLAVGLCRMFLSEKPKLSDLTAHFKSNYRHTVVTMLIYNICISAMTTAVTVIYLGVMAGGVVIFTALYQFSTYGYWLASLIFFVIFTAFLYFMVVINLSYDFLLIPYLLAQNPQKKFMELFKRNRKLARLHKGGMFLTEFVFLAAEALVVCLPMMLISFGLVRMYLGVGGNSLTILGLFAIIPSMLATIFISVFRKSAWAGIYNELIEIEVPDKTFDRYRVIEENGEIVCVKMDPDEKV